MHFHIIIPARFNSSRLPGKPLMDIKGKTLIERVFDRAKLCGALSVVIATDDDKIEETAKQFGATVCRTKESHPTGTDRIAEACDILGLSDDTIVVNLQGDEPLISPVCVGQIVRALEQHPHTFMTTLCSPIAEIEHLRDANVVKVVLDKNGFALYFSRATLPFSREGKEETLIRQNTFFRHIGVYAFRVSALKKYLHFAPCMPETVEHLEPIRALWEGERIHVSLANESFPPGVDTMDDLVRVRQLF